MAKSAAAHGAEIRVDAPRARGDRREGRAVGVVTESGETIRARAVISNLNPKLLYGALIDRAALPPRSRSGSRNGAAAPARSA
jgi:phytoene dehydrogenase-like protein